MRKNSFIFFIKLFILNKFIMNIIIINIIIEIGEKKKRVLNEDGIILK